MNRLPDFRSLFLQAGRPLVERTAARRIWFVDDELDVACESWCGVVARSERTGDHVPDIEGVQPRGDELEDVELVGHQLRRQQSEPVKAPATEDARPRDIDCPSRPIEPRNSHVQPREALQVIRYSITISQLRSC